MDWNTVILLGVAVLNVVTAVIAYRTKNLAERTEVNTNSMREQLVAAVKVTSHAEGVEDEKARARGPKEP